MKRHALSLAVAAASTLWIGAADLALAKDGWPSAGAHAAKGHHKHHRKPPAEPMVCEDLAGARLPGLEVSVAETIAADASVPAPAHCRVLGTLDARIGVDGKDYAIGFELRLPEAWNGRFLFQGGGGNDGVIRPALGAIGNGQPTNALSEGFAVVSTDAGHTAENVPVIGGQLFGIDPQARVDYGYNAIERVGETAKALIALRYAEKARYSYFIGCSNGGRQGMVAAERFPRLFDGIVSGNPGYNLPRAAVQHPWDVQAFGAAAPKAADGRPILSQSFSNSDLTLVTDAVTAQCDALDGLADGIIENQPACHFDPAVLQCAGAKTDACLSGAQVEALHKVFGGAKNGLGEALYADWPYDTGVSAAGWRAWKIGTATTSMPNSRIVTLGGPSLPYIFMTPPDEVAGATPDQNALAVYDYLLNYDFDANASRIDESSGIYTESSMQFMSAKPRIAPFRAHGGKLILYHGTSDPVFSVNDTIAYYQQLAKRSGGYPRTGRFARLFVVPGMNHCSGGPATDGFNTLAPIVEWVEKGRAPTSIDATARPENGTAWPGRTRPLCPYPLQARYTGRGSIEQAENFRCVNVSRRH
ncbi:tannase/feruloyl esterase family alpha/beta hydrolase [Denitromonas iodatirespirans]|uniref:Tannase/feruloyl esterase family alpha/beta hydrolase n=1 Tax=Denitromonas iodatirespirans TaxID=2795389 RepID=A0A944DEF5_DENI1|nr:tannase/feruloyl esterase family alpha/beta hydrolase [Denitromonas iodatirespirans]MBT0962938.1 tannase/feruloyl esterase family alpha/beta hydrolase [Denitromonas iodatirespirans]